MSRFEDEFLSELGFDPKDPRVKAAADDAEVHARIIETLAKIRLERGLSQKVVAKRMQTTQSRVSNFERIGGDPRLSTLLRYARAVDAKLRLSAVAVPRGWSSVETAQGTTQPVARKVDPPLSWTSAEAKA